MALLKSLSEYHISQKTGFLPDVQPCSRLPVYFEPWESLISELPLLIRTNAIHSRVEALPQLEVSQRTLPRDEDWWRAYTVATFIGQGYIWADEEAVRATIPECIAVPWWKIAKRLDMPAVVNYSNTCLFNWRLGSCTEPMDQDNLHALTTFSGLEDEMWFYKIFLLVEMSAATGLKAIVEGFSAVAVKDEEKLASLLETINTSLENMTKQMRKVHEHCKPEKFWHEFRRFQRGTKGYGQYLPDGLIYQGVDQTPKHFCGASAGQSSTIPSFDIFLGVTQGEHETTFLQEQRMYMPLPHRTFLDDLEKEAKVHPVRAFIVESKNCALVASFNSIIDTLVKFRQEHFNIVFRYIIAFTPGAVNTAKGTGGTTLKQFLKDVQQNTTNAKIII